MPIEVKFIKDCDVGKIGEIKNYSKGSAKSIVEQGYAEYIEEKKSSLYTFDYILEEVVKQEDWKTQDNINFKDLNLDDYQERDSEFMAQLMKLKNGWKEFRGALKETIKSIFKNNKEENNLEEDFLIIKYNKKGDKISTLVDIDKVAEFIENKFDVRTIFGIKEETIEVYNEGIWTIKGRGIIKAEIERILGVYARNNVVSEILEKIKRRTEISREEADIVPDFKRVVENGVIDLEDPENIKFLKHSKEYNFRSKFPIIYNSNSKCPKIINFVKKTFYEEDIKKVQEWFGVHLPRRYVKKKASLFHGPPDTGKTITLNLLTKFLGSNISGLSIQEIGRGKPFDLMVLKDKDANICDDLSSSDINTVGGFKKAVGDGFIDGEMKFGDKFKFRNTAKNTNACNKIPAPKEDIDDLAYYGRILLFPVDNVIPLEKQDDKLLEKLTTPEELSGLLNWAIEGYIRLQKQNRFSNDKAPEETKFLMIKGGNSLAEFSSEVLIESPGLKISKEVLYRIYCKWCMEHKPKLSPDTKDKIGKNLIKFIPYIQSAKSGDERYWLNLKVRGKWDTFLNNMSGYLDSDNKSIDNDIYKFSKPVPAVPQKKQVKCDGCENEAINFLNNVPLCKDCYKKIPEDFK